LGGGFGGGGGGGGGGCEISDRVKSVGHDTTLHVIFKTICPPNCSWYINNQPSHLLIFHEDYGTG